jgi:hypothetical protein
LVVDIGFFVTWAYSKSHRATYNMTLVGKGGERGREREREKERGKTD